VTRVLGGHWDAIRSLVRQLFGLTQSRARLKKMQTALADWYWRHSHYLAEFMDVDEATDLYVDAVANCHTPDLFSHCWWRAGRLRPSRLAVAEFPDSPRRQRLVMAFKLMAEHSRSTGGVFSLSCRQVAAVLGYVTGNGEPCPERGWRTLKGMRVRGILVLDTPGKQGGRGKGKDAAAKWRYTGD
jgi:hypothetical protein